MNHQHPPGSPEKICTRKGEEVKPQKALVQCEGYRCLAFRDAEGNWKDARDNPIKVVQVIQEL